jgi:RimJ/RimL family protein N-acetyltransferase
MLAALPLSRAGRPRYAWGVAGLDPVVLEGKLVRLEPLRRSHLDALCTAGCDLNLWTLTVGNGGTPAAMKLWLEQALADVQHGTALAFATLLRGDGRLVGSTRFCNLSHKDRRIEIGFTWVAREWQRQGVNREAKYLMLRHAFEVWRMQRVEFKTDAINQTARQALLALGAREEGVLRKHMLTWTGRTRDSVCFAILDDEWPAVKARLEASLQRGG